MTSDELSAIVKGVVVAVRKRVRESVDGVTARVAVLEVQTMQFAETTKALPDVRERVAVLETRAPVPGPPGRDGTDGPGDLEARLRAADVQLASLAAAVTGIGAMRERLAVLETRAPVPGPAGAPGRDGLDGVGFDDVVVEHDGERAVTVKGVHGDVVKVLGTFTLPTPIYRGVWIEGRTYEPGDGVTWAGSEWHCLATTTTKPGDGSKAWTLKVKRGRDGKDGKDGPSGPPGPAGKDWQQVYDDTRRR